MKSSTAYFYKGRLFTTSVSLPLPHVPVRASAQDRSSHLTLQSPHRSRLRAWVGETDPGEALKEVQELLPRSCPPAARGCQPCPGSRGPWADQTVLLSSASWQAVPSALRRHLRQPNFLLRGPLWAWIQNKKHRGKKKKKHQGRGSKWTEAGQPCEEQARLVPGFWPCCWLSEPRQL